MSWEVAANQVITVGTRDVRNVKGVDLVQQAAHVENGKVTGSRATVHVAFVVIDS